MRGYKLRVLLGTLMVLSLFEVACGLMSSSTSSSFSPDTTPVTTPATSLSSPLASQLTPAPSVPVEKEPEIAQNEGNNSPKNEIGDSRETATRQEPSSEWQINQNKTDLEADDESLMLSKLADEDEVANSDDEVTESEEINNEGMVTHPTTAPDFVIDTVVWSPANPSIGDTVTLDVTIHNQGNDKSGSSNAACYIDDVHLASAPIDPINPGGAVMKTFTWTAEAGAHVIKAVADQNNEVVESDEDNNEKIIVFSTLAPDLIVQDITWSPENPSRGDEVTFTISLKNQGNSESVCSRVYFYIDGASRSYRDVQRIAADATVTKTFTWIAQAGSHILKAIADGINQVAERD